MAELAKHVRQRFGTYASHPMAVTAVLQLAHSGFYHLGLCASRARDIDSTEPAIVVFCDFKFNILTLSKTPESVRQYAGLQGKGKQIKSV